jgi:hypothetical protein
MKSDISREGEEGKQADFSHLEATNQVYHGWEQGQAHQLKEGSIAALRWYVLDRVQRDQGRLDRESTACSNQNLSRNRNQSSSCVSILDRFTYLIPCKFRATCIGGDCLEEPASYRDQDCW